MPEFSSLEGPIRTLCVRFAVPALLALGCSGSKDDVALSARIEAAELAVTEGALASRLTGQFDLVLAVGEYAAKATSVSAPTFSVLRGDTALISPLNLSAEESFPVSIAPDSRTTIRFLVAENEAISTADAAALCAGPVRISGTMTDTLSGGKQTPADSTSFDVSCP